jgi:hypothetical protein
VTLAPGGNGGRVEHGCRVCNKPLDNLIQADKGGEAAGRLAVRKLLRAGKEPLDTAHLKLRKTERSSATPPAVYVRSFVQVP